MAYIGIERCGCVTAAVVDSPGREKDTRKAVSGFMRDGLSIERGELETLRPRLFTWCAAHKDMHPDVRRYAWHQAQFEATGKPIPKRVSAAAKAALSKEKVTK